MCSHFVLQTSVLGRLRKFLAQRCKGNGQRSGHDALCDEEFISRHGGWHGPNGDGAPTGSVSGPMGHRGPARLNSPKWLPKPPTGSLRGGAAAQCGEQVFGRVPDVLVDVEEGLRCLCSYGPPGTGKTALAEHMAHEMQRPLMVRQASDLVSKFLGETERNMARMFDEAQTEEAGLLPDEAASFLRGRGMAQRNYEVSEVNEMLQGMERFAGIFICTTNLFLELDEAASASRHPRRMLRALRISLLDRVRTARQAGSATTARHGVRALRRMTFAAARESFRIAV